jgi:hypothetical protein
VTMDIGHLKAFVICGMFCSIGTILSYGPRRFFESRREGKHPFQAAIGAFVLGGLGGLLFYPLLKALGLSQPAPHIQLFRIAEWASLPLSIVLVIELSWAAQQALATVRLYKRTPLAVATSTLRYTLRSRNAWFVLLPILSVLVFCVVLPLRHVEYPKIILLPVILLHLTTLAQYATPSAVLLLASSRWESVRLFNLIERGIYPYRVVVLLEPSQTECLRHSRHHWMHFEVDNLRILGPHSWRDVVRRISESAPIVVLDTRRASPAVVEETSQMLEEPFCDKTLFVIAEDGSAPSVTAAQPNRCISELHTVRLGEVIGELKRMGLTKTTSPDESPLLAKASYTQNSKKIEKGMMTMARAGIPFASALDTAEQAHGITGFLTEARNLQRRLIGDPGDGALEVFAQLSADITETEAFITQWRQTTVHEYQNVIARAVVVHHALCNLQQAIDYAPPVFLQKNEETLRSMRGGK